MKLLHFSYRQFKKIQAVLPKDPDKQKKILIKLAENDMLIPLGEHDEERYMYYYTQGIKPEDLSPYNHTYLKQAIKKIPSKYKLLKDYHSMIATHKKEILQLYDDFTRKNLLQYILKDPKERKRLRITRIRRDYPILIVRAPVPWHNSFCVSQQLMEKHFYNGNMVVLEIRDLWEFHYSDMFILPTDQIEEIGKFPLELDVLENQIDNLCQASRDRLVHTWLPSCADIFLKYKSHWKKYIPLTPTDSPVLVERFFDCVNGLLSMQLRRLVMKSLRHLLSFLVIFKCGNDFGSEYQDLALINLPVIKLTPRVEEPGSQKIVLHPPLDEIRLFIERCFDKILRVGRNILRIENYIFPEFNENETFLFAVGREEPPVEDIYEEALASFDTNLLGPQKYLKNYEQYYYILNGSAEKEMLAFFEVLPFPFLKDFSKKIHHYEDLKKEIIFLRRSIPLNFISLECGELNDTLYKIIDDIRSYIVNYFITENHNHNRK